LLTDAGALSSWAADPAGFARAQLGGSAAASMIAGLDRTGLEETFVVLARKTATENRLPPTEAHLGRPGTKSENDSPPEGLRLREQPSSPVVGSPVAGPRPRAAPRLGCAFRPPLVLGMFDELGTIDLWEHIVDWYVPSGGDRRLARFAASAPISLHSLKLSVGSGPTEEQDKHVQRVAALVKVAGVDHLSDHLAFAQVGSMTLPHFLPLWRIDEQLELAVENVDRFQSELGVRLLLENPASPFDPGGEMSTAEFLNELCARSGCEVLLDLENLRVNAANGLADAERELSELELQHVGGAHLAGGTDPGPDGPALDSHSSAVREVVWGWLGRVLAQAPNCRWVVLERDGGLENVDEVVSDLCRLRAVLRGGPRLQGATS
jgi:hypothetical protein